MKKIIAGLMVVLLLSSNLMAITSNDISSDATATATADVGNTVITQTSTLTQSYTQN